MRAMPCRPKSTGPRSPAKFWQRRPSGWAGVAVRTLGTGQALRQALLRPAQVFQAGSQVRVLAQGAGFQVVSDGLALSAGVIGQTARVRMDNGRVMSGLVSDHKTVQLDL